jgi:predicted DCC family thiol-disulfide oxidoreductase YuxK
MEERVVLFDGECNLCQWSVKFIIQRDPRAYFKFASIQSSAGKRLLEERGVPSLNLDSFVLVEGRSYFTRSDAALRVARHLSGLWPLLTALTFVPHSLLDWAYDVIARNRYRWFGRPTTCMVPSQALRMRFLQDA